MIYELAFVPLKSGITACVNQADNKISECDALEKCILYWTFMSWIMGNSFIKCTVNCMHFCVVCEVYMKTLVPEAGIQAMDK